MAETQSQRRPQTEPCAEAPVPSLRALSELLLLECLFTVAGGYMDAYAYLAHGHVFANAQTGNVVLLAVALATSNWHQASLHVPPILACVAGVASADLLGVRAEKHSFRATLTCQLIQLGAVATLFLLQNKLSNVIFVPVLSFSAALQITSFGKLGPWSFNTAMTTGNLRSATTSLVAWARGEQTTMHRGQAVVAGTACLAFASGAVAGALVTRQYPQTTLLYVLLLLSAAALLTWHERHSFGSAGSTPVSR